MIDVSMDVMDATSDLPIMNSTVDANMNNTAGFTIMNSTVDANMNSTAGFTTINSTVDSTTDYNTAGFTTINSTVDSTTDYSSDEYHEDSLPDLVLSSSVKSTEDFLATLDLCPSSLDLTMPDTEVDDITDIEAEYFHGHDQVSADGMTVSYTNYNQSGGLACRARADIWKSYLNLAIPSDEEDLSDGTIADNFESLGPCEQSRQREEWLHQLELTDAEIKKLKKQYVAKIRRAQELKRHLGITAWREFSDDMALGIKKLQETGVYLKVEEKFNDIARQVEKVMDKAKDNAIEVMDKAKDNAKEVIDKAKENAKDAMDKASVGINKAQRKTTQGFQTAQRKTAEGIDNITGSDKEYRKGEHEQKLKVENDALKGESET